MKNCHAPNPKGEARLTGKSTWERHACTVALERCLALSAACQKHISCVHGSLKWKTRGSYVTRSSTTGGRTQWLLDVPTSAIFCSQLHRLEPVDVLCRTAIQRANITKLYAKEEITSREAPIKLHFK